MSSDSRKPAHFLERRTVQIVISEGLSELIYLNTLRAKFEGMPINKVNARGGDIKRLKKECEKLIAEKDERDMIAVVMDMDEKDSGTVLDFERWCSERNIELYVSNPSFEVFLLMHFEDVKGNLSQTDLEEALSRHMGRKYEKSRGIKFTNQSFEEAVARAKKSVQGKNSPVRKVSVTKGTTNIHLLACKIAKNEVNKKIE